MHCTLKPIPDLPLDVLRLIFEHGAIDDNRMALALSVVCRLSQQWIDRILYAIVNLHRQSSSRAFLRTINTSRTKSPLFFATHVKSLCISHDIYDETAFKIVSTCCGATNLTLWAIPPSPTASPFHQHIDIYLQQPLQPRDYSYPLHHYRSPTATGRSVQYPPVPYPMEQTALALAKTPLRPSRLSILLHPILGSTSSPCLHLPFFSRITHLSVVNKWEEWTSWTGFEYLTNLTHLSFDLSVVENQLSYPFTFPSHTQNEDGSSRMNKARKVANTFIRVLYGCTSLKVCMVLLLFDADPVSTARGITRIIEDDCKGLYDVGTRLSRTQKMYCGMERLVFARDREPFHEREAHSLRESERWRRAENVVEAQRRFGSLILDM